MSVEKFVPSEETLPQSDTRDAAAKSLNAKCRQLIELAHDLQSSERRLSSESNAENVDAKKLTECAILHGKIQERFFNLRAEIEAEHRGYVQDNGMSIYLVHTEAGLPIRVNDRCRKNPWDT